MKQLTERQAVLFAFIASVVSLLAMLGGAFAFRTIWFNRESGQTESRDISGQIVTQGRRIFVKHCAECHGFDGRGEEGSDLHSLHTGDALTRQIIIGGIKGEMPAYGKVLGEAEVRALVTYLRTLRN